MTTSSWVMTVGVRLQGLALARATAMSAIPTAAATASTMSATALAACEDFPSAVETAAKTAATHKPTASIACAAAARRSPTGRGGGWAGAADWAGGAGTSDVFGWADACDVARAVGLAGPRGPLARPVPLACAAIYHTHPQDPGPQRLSA